MKKFIIAILCLAFVSGGGYGGYRHYQKKKDAKRIVDVVPITLLAENYWADDTTLDAEVTSGSSQSVYLDSDKIVKNFKVSVGDEVKVGDVLIEYDMTVTELETQQKKNQIAVIKQEIAEEEAELVRLQNLLPSELAPAGYNSDDYDDDDYDYDYDYDDDDLDDDDLDDDDLDDDDLDDDDLDDDDNLDDDDEEEPAVPINKVDTLRNVSQAADKDEKGIYYFNCSVETNVTKMFMTMIRATKKHVILNVYSDKDELLYSWDMDCKENDKIEVYEWCVSDGVTIEKGTLSYDGSAAGKCGNFVVYSESDMEEDDDDDDLIDDNDSTDSQSDTKTDSKDSTTANTDSETDSVTVKKTTLGDSLDDFDDDLDDDDLDDDDLDDDDLGDTDDYSYSYDYDDDDDDDTGSDDASENYVYTRAELDKKIKEQQTEIKSLKLDLKEARLEYKDSKNQTDEGVELAKIDGVVTKIGTLSSSSDSDEEDEWDEDLDDDEDEWDEDLDDSDDDSAYIVIQGDSGVSVEISVGELNLEKFEVGTTVSGMSYDTGESFTAVVTGIKDEPSSYSSYMWNENPNSSTYTVTASVEGETSLSVGSWVTMSMPTDETSSGGLYIPIQYLHKDGSQYYVMKADENGLLKKQYVKSGKVIWGSYLEIKGGISLDDKICFPYGTDVKEGVKTRDSEEVLY